MSIDPEIIELVQSLSLPEKIGQLTQLNIDLIINEKKRTSIDCDKLRKIIREFHIGSFLNSPLSTPSQEGGLPCVTIDQWRRIIHDIQTVCLEERILPNTENQKAHPIPMVFGLDSVHGANYIQDATIFPQQINAGASFNRDLCVQMGAITAIETRMAGIPWVFSPICDIARHLRWSRVYETFGEDPYLCAELGRSIIEGLQGSPIDISSSSRVAACMKHFIGYSETVTGDDRAPTYIPDHILYEHFVPPFEAAIKAGVETAMESYTSLNGVPVCCSELYLNQLLRQDLQFQGMLVTDWAEIRNLHSKHRVAANDKEAVRIALLNTSIDMSMVPTNTSFCSYLKELVSSGHIPEDRVDKACARVLQFKKNLGLFKNPMAWPIEDDIGHEPKRRKITSTTSTTTTITTTTTTTNTTTKSVGSASSWKIALEMARQSITLLENKTNILPLDPLKLSKVLVCGPVSHSKCAQSGGWTIKWQGAQSDTDFGYGSTILEGIRSFSNAFSVKHFKGSHFDKPDEKFSRDACIREAKESDVVIVCVGEEAYAEHPGNIPDQMLPTVQRELVSDLIASKARVIVILVQGRPRVLDGCISGAEAVISAYLPGPTTGQAIAEILFGVINPSGRLPYSYPTLNNGAPVYYYRTNLEAKTTPVQWEFGHGLSYTSFKYSDLTMSTNCITVNKDSKTDTPLLDMSIRITNTGTVPGRHSVLLFLSRKYRSIVPEARRLKRFKKIFLRPNETTTVSWALYLIDLQYFRPIGSCSSSSTIKFGEKLGGRIEQVIEFGRIQVQVGNCIKEFTIC